MRKISTWMAPVGVAVILVACVLAAVLSSRSDHPSTPRPPTGSASEDRPPPIPDRERGDTTTPGTAAAGEIEGAERDVREAFHVLVQAHLDLDFEEVWSLLAEQAREDLAERLEREKGSSTRLPLWYREVLDRARLSTMDAQEFFLAIWNVWLDPERHRFNFRKEYMQRFFGEPTVRRVILEGDRASVEFELPGWRSGVFAFLEERGRWRFQASRGFPELDLPWSGSAVEDMGREDEPRVVVNVLPDGRISVGKGSQLGLEDALAEAGGEEIYVLLRCGRQTSWERLSRLYLLLAGRGLYRIQIATREPGVESFGAGRQVPDPGRSSPILFESDLIFGLERKLFTFLPRKPDVAGSVDFVVELRGASSAADREALRARAESIAESSKKAVILLCPGPATSLQEVLAGIDAFMSAELFDILLAAPPPTDTGAPGIFLNGWAVDRLTGDDLPRVPTDHPALKRIIVATSRGK